ELVEGFGHIHGFDYLHARPSSELGPPSCSSDWESGRAMGMRSAMLRSRHWPEFGRGRDGLVLSWLCTSAHE
ncbi:hypothetical protein Dimus_005811, partial [Dionaea muscipula]